MINPQILITTKKITIMKKIYIEPRLRTVAFAAKHQVCSESNVGVGGTKDTPIDAEAKDNYYDEGDIW